MYKTPTEEAEGPYKKGETTEVRLKKPHGNHVADQPSIHQEELQIWHLKVCTMFETGKARQIAVEMRNYKLTF
jgi:hypothetical protein